TTALDSVRSTLELDHVESHLHPRGSFDVADHATPTGREETWRFTPLKRLRGLHADAGLSGRTTKLTFNDVDGAQVSFVTGDDAKALQGVSGWSPSDRWSARVLDE